MLSELRMKRALVFIFLGVLMSQDCSSRSVPDDENSVVSVYTTQSTATGVSIDVYRQIAHNIAERITMPIYRLFGFSGNGTKATTTQRPWDKIELQDEPVPAKDVNEYPFDNSISNDKDTEELSPESLHKVEQRPEKIILFSSYTPSSTIENLDRNDTVNEIDDDSETFGFDDVSANADDKSSGSLIHFLELMGSFIQLVYGGIKAFFSLKQSG